jgi:hypothetical protein
MMFGEGYWVEEGGYVVGSVSQCAYSDIAATLWDQSVRVGMIKTRWQFNQTPHTNQHE